ncbi:hypothetical protein [Clostridium sp.]|jgi:hypothetical protein|uniref:hypothetical protein n=1 Tax=Clostridium sp. TaxID=1506 RepID=UPI00258DF26A|nr:hypothetical protein [Clostridium sp.]MDF2503632.1 hypothetical protein [Clostridium sp.]
MEHLKGKVITPIIINKENRVRLRQLVKELLVINAISEDRANLIIHAADTL